jgi:2-oxoisovalerate dehydrogenase E1 component
MNYDLEILKAIEIRATEEKLLWAYARGLVRGTVHTCIGQEFNSVFVSKYLKNDLDWVLSNHRGHGHFLAFNGTPELLIREILGDVGGPSRGVGGSQHIKYKNFMTNGIQGGFAPISLGIAEVISESATEGICVLWIGDGTLGSGQLWESLNLASVLSLPILIVLEDNEIAQSTPSDFTFAGDLRLRIEGFGFNYFKCDGAILEELDQVAEMATEFVRKKRKPALLHINSGRVNSHSKGDDNRDVKTLNKVKSRDPFRNIMEEEGVAEIILQVKNKIDKTFENILIQTTYFDDSREPNFADPHVLTSYPSHNFEQSSQRDLIYANLAKALETFPNLKIFGEDIMEFVGSFDRSYGGAFKITKDLSTRFPNRLRNMPISESAFIGMGAGRALMGQETIVEIMFGDFLTLGFDQILNQISKIPSMYGEKIQLPLIIRTPMGAGFGYGATHSQSIEKHFLGIPNLLVIAPSVFSEDFELFENLLNLQRPVLIIESKRNYSEKIPIGISEKFKISEQKMDRITLSHYIFSDGVKSDILLVTYGGLAKIAHQVQVELGKTLKRNFELLAIEDLSRGVNAFGENFKKYRYIFSIEEGTFGFGMGSEIGAVSLENGFRGKFSRISGSGVIGATKIAEENSTPTFDKIIRAIAISLEQD